MRPFHYSNASIRSHNTRCWLFFFLKLINENYPKKTYAMTLPADGSVFVPFGTDCILSVHCFDCSSSQVWSEEPMFHPWLWIDSKTRLYCCETSPNTRLQHPHDVVFSIVSKRGSHLAPSVLMSKIFSQYDVQHFLKCLPCLLAGALSVDGHRIPLSIFFNISGVVTSFGRPLRCLSWQLVRPRIISVTQCYTVVNEGTDFPRVESSSALIWVVLRSFKWK